MYVQECGYVALVEQTDVPQINGLLEQHGRRNHAAIHVVPCGPHSVPLIDRWHSERRRRTLPICGQGGSGEEWERERGALEQPERILRGAVGPAVNNTQLGLGEERISILFGILEDDGWLVSLGQFERREYRRTFWETSTLIISSGRKVILAPLVGSIKLCASFDL